MTSYINKELTYREKLNETHITESFTIYKVRQSNTAPHRFDLKLGIIPVITHCCCFCSNEIRRSEVCISFTLEYPTTYW